MLQILVIEDEENINRLLCEILGRTSYQVTSSYNGLDGLRRALEDNYDLVLLDLMLPLKQGEEVLKEIREKKNTPVIVLSAKNAVYNRIELLRLGADDYITKPFDMDEVLLRIEAVLRRTNKELEKKVCFGKLSIDAEGKRVYFQEEEIVCTTMEYEILYLLLCHPEKIFSKRSLYETITGENYISDENSMNVHISNLRKKLGKYTEEEYIETIYGMGYRMKKN